MPDRDNPMSGTVECPLWVNSGHPVAIRMSALPLKADMLSVGIDVGYVPQADIHRITRCA